MREKRRLVDSLMETITMSNKLEKTFFDTFGIKPKFKGYSNAEELYNGGVIPCGNIKYFNTIEEMDEANYWCFNMWELDDEDKEYPQITDHILLELILINMHYEDLFGNLTNTQELKDNTLKQLIETYNKFSTCVTYDGEYQRTARKIKHQISILFEEG